MGCVPVVNRNGNAPKGIGGSNEIFADVISGGFAYGWLSFAS